MNTAEKTEKSDFIKLFASIAELYSKPLSQPILEIYWNILKKYSLQKIQHSIHLHLLDIEQGKFMPKPADLLKYLEKSPEEKASHAWAQVNTAIGFVGVYDSVIFEDEIIHAVITEMGGWIRLCHLPESQLPFEEREFCRRYVTYQYHPPTACPTKLIGLYNNKEPVRINLKENPLTISLK